jgi:hypothetical protein
VCATPAHKFVCDRDQAVLVFWVGESENQKRQQAVAVSGFCRMRRIKLAV